MRRGRKRLMKPCIVGGIVRVWVNGEEVYTSGNATDKFPGIFIKK